MTAHFTGSVSRTAWQKVKEGDVQGVNLERNAESGIEETKRGGDQGKMALWGLIPDFNDFVAFGKLVLVVGILVIIGVLFLMNKLVAIPKPWSMILGLGFIGGAVYVVYYGGF